MILEALLLVTSKHLNISETANDAKKLKIPSASPTLESESAQSTGKTGCDQEKEMYDRCFRNWFRYSYLRKDFEDTCCGYFDEYSSCLKKVLDARGLGQLNDINNPIWFYEAL